MIKGPQEDPGATDVRPQFCWQCCPCCPCRKLFCTSLPASQRTTHLFGQEVSLKKTEVLHQPAPQEEYCPPHITTDMIELTVVYQFNYLKCILTLDTKINKEVDNRPAKVSSGLNRLYKQVRYNTWSRAQRSACIVHHPCHPLVWLRVMGHFTTYDLSCQVGWSCRIHQLHLCRGGKTKQVSRIWY